MVRERLTALAYVLLLASSVQGGELKLHRWPMSAPQAIPVHDIPVLMDVVDASVCRVVGTPVKLLRVAARTFEGCGSVLVQCSINVTLSCSIVPTGAVPGTYSASLSQEDIDAPGGVTRLCVKLTDAHPGGEAGKTNVEVAIVTIRVCAR